VSIFENSWVTRLDVAQGAGADNLAHTAQGTVRARHLLIAGGALLGRLVPALANKLMDIGTYVAATQPLGEERARALITNNAAAADMNWILDYFRLSSDYRLLFGGRVSYSGVDPFDSARVLRRRIAKVFPQLTEARIEYAWGGYLDITLNRAPHFGRLGPNAYFVQGSFRTRHGDFRNRGQAGERGDRRHCRTLRHVYPHPASPFSRWPAVPPAGIGAGHVVVSYPGPALTSATFEFAQWFSVLPVLLVAALVTWLLSLPLRNVALVEPLWSLMLFAAGVWFAMDSDPRGPAPFAGVVAAGNLVGAARLAPGHAQLGPGRAAAPCRKPRAPRAAFRDQESLPRVSCSARCWPGSCRCHSWAPSPASAR
jgi:hypothetical protein